MNIIVHWRQSQNRPFYRCDQDTWPEIKMEAKPPITSLSCIFQWNKPERSMANLLSSTGKIIGKVTLTWSSGLSEYIERQYLSYASWKLLNSWRPKIEIPTSNSFIHEKSKMFTSILLQQKFFFSNLILFSLSSLYCCLTLKPHLNNVPLSLIKTQTSHNKTTSIVW